MTQLFDEQQKIELIEEKRQIEFLLKDLYFARTANTQADKFYNFAIVEFGTKTKVYDVITRETYLPVKNLDSKAIQKAGGKFAYNIIPLTKALIAANIKEADVLLTKEDVIFLRSELAKYLKTNQSNSELSK